MVYLASRLGLWHATSLRETLYWYVGVALVLAGSATHASDLGQFRKLFGRVFKVTIAIEFLVNLYVFPLAVELVVIPLAILFAGVQVVAERDPKLAPVRNVATFILVALGVVTVAFALTMACPRGCTWSSSSCPLLSRSHSLHSSTSLRCGARTSKSSSASTSTGATRVTCDGRSWR